MSTKKRNQKEQDRRILGIYNPKDGPTAVGELRLEGSNTLLKVHADFPLDSFAQAANITGTSFTGKQITLIDCFSPGVGHTHFQGKPTKYHADIFPHYVAIGHGHIEPNDRYVKAIHFTTNDLTHLFYDFDAFSNLIDAKAVIEEVLKERRKMRPVETGEHPQIAYFTGKTQIVETETTIGKVSVHHRPTHNLGGPAGVYIKNRMVVTIEPDEPIAFDDAIDRMYVVAAFLSVAAGRRQGIKHVQIATLDHDNGVPRTLQVHPSYRWKASNKIELFKPHPGDLPLDPIQHSVEFETVFCNWIARHKGWKVARSRYIDCLQKSNEYDGGRLVAAANMFDILPVEATPAPSTLTGDLAKTRDECRALFRKLPAGIDRNSALDALGRLGKPSLPKKVAYRVSIVESRLGAIFPDIQIPAAVAVKCRNYLVHGSAGDIDYSRVEPLLPFLTDTLEFVFAASDFIESGWNTQRWASSSYGWGHSFTRYRAEYSVALAKLRGVLLDDTPSS
ncbi:HEPN domain-containing protein [Dyella sp. C11]|uniref:ApeA N-terminal domain 1-containing protein n=1 Tax=Dyella sp. C11 TaxID=2126991 RepID=UPI00130042D7|nr:HEPN domain-containing protein [Dyella sp. C11]